jgi:hypothetical protein
MNVPAVIGIYQSPGGNAIASGDGVRATLAQVAGQHLCE